MCVRVYTCVCLMSPGMLRGTGGGKWKSKNTGKESMARVRGQEGREGEIDEVRF